MAGAGRGGGYEWRAAGQPVAAGAAALELSGDGTITKFTVVWDGSLLDERAITALAADAVDRRRERKRLIMRAMVVREYADRGLTARSQPNADHPDLRAHLTVPLHASHRA